MLAHKLFVQAYISAADLESAGRWLADLKEMVSGDLLKPRYRDSRATSSINDRKRRKPPE